jgi:hypothetical protein
VIKGDALITTRSIGIVQLRQDLIGGVRPALPAASPLAIGCRLHLLTGALGALRGGFTGFIHPLLGFVDRFADTLAGTVGGFGRGLPDLLDLLAGGLNRLIDLLARLLGGPLTVAGADECSQQQGARHQDEWIFRIHLGSPH